MFRNGYGLAQQTPKSPSPGPAAAHRKTPAWQQVPVHNANAPSTQTQREGARTLAARTAATQQEDPPALSPGFTFPGCPGVRGALLSGCALSPAARRSRQLEPASLRPAPGRQAPPLGSGSRLCKETLLHPDRSAGFPCGLLRWLPPLPSQQLLMRTKGQDVPNCPKVPSDKGGHWK